MSKSVSFTVAEEMRELYRTRDDGCDILQQKLDAAKKRYQKEVRRIKEKYVGRLSTEEIGKRFGLSQPRTHQIVTSKENPITPTKEERKRFGIKWKKPKQFKARFNRGNQTYYWLKDGRVWHYEKQCFRDDVEIREPPKIKGLKRKRYDTDNATFVVYSDGRIWAFSSQKFLTLSRTKNAGFYAPGKQRMGRLMLTLFKRPPKDDEVARHIDGDETTNHINNLEWGTRQDNVDDQIVYGSAKRGKRASNARLKDHEAQDILDKWHRTKHKWASMNEYAKQTGDTYGVTPTSVYNLLKGVTWKHLSVSA